MLDYDKATPEQKKTLDIQQVIKIHEQALPPGVMRQELDPFIVTGDVAGAKERALDLLRRHSRGPVDTPLPDMPIRSGSYMTRAAEEGPTPLRDIVFAQIPELSNLPEGKRGFQLHEEHRKMYTGRDMHGMVVPSSALAARTMSTNVGSSGGYLVAEDLLADQKIGLLENESVCINLGARTMTGLVGDADIPKQTGGATAYWINEGEDLTESTPTFGQVRLSPKTVGCYTDLTRRMLVQSAIDVENFLRQEFARKLAIAIDLAALSGTGANGQPKGVLEATGIGSDSGSITLANLIGMPQDLADNNALRGSLAFAMDSASAGTLMQTPYVDSTDSRMLLDIFPAAGETARLLGHKAMVSNQLSSQIIFGDWSQMIIGFWSGLDVLVDRTTLGKSGGVRVICFQDVDVAIRHPESFSEFTVSG
ncbi:MAG: phage major capsid protein [Desulfobulbaceae bacterium]|nr:phage major capsid protein [Desulfobulbaceae bacterium]